MAGELWRANPAIEVITDKRQVRVRKICLPLNAVWEIGVFGELVVFPIIVITPGIIVIVRGVPSSLETLVFVVGNTSNHFMSSANGIIATESESVIIIILPSTSDGLLLSAVHKIGYGSSIPELRGIDREGLSDITSSWPPVRRNDRKTGGSSGGSSVGRSGGGS